MHLLVYYLYHLFYFFLPFIIYIIYFILYHLFYDLYQLFSSASFLFYFFFKVSGLTAYPGSVVPWALMCLSVCLSRRTVEHCLHMFDRMVIYFFIAASYAPW